jgi:hypothetical protein
MWRMLPVFLELGLLVYCLIDCIQTPDGAHRNLSKGIWILLILFFPIVGGIAWLVAGRPARSPYGRNEHVSGYPEYRRGQARPTAPDDDPDFLRQLRKVDSEHESTLKDWEADLRRREAELERRDRPADEPPAPA